MTVPLIDAAFTGSVIEWRGPAPFYFVALPDDLIAEVRWAATQASYGWGCVPVHAEVDGVSFTTSLFPRNGGYLLPLKLAVRRQVGAVADDMLNVRMVIAAPQA